MPDALVAQTVVVLAQLEIPIETVLHAARQARTARVSFVLDAAPATDVPDELLALADLVTVNSEGAKALSRLDVEDRASALAAALATTRLGARASLPLRAAVDVLRAR